jgi:ankyrin repeat protein
MIFAFLDTSKKCALLPDLTGGNQVCILYICLFLIKHEADIHERDDAAFRWASLNGHKDTVALLLEHKADIHAQDDYALRWASHKGHKDTVALLIEYGADIHARQDFAFRYTSENGNQDIMALLKHPHGGTEFC